MQLTIYDRNQKLFRFYKRADLIITKEHNRKRKTPKPQPPNERMRDMQSERASETYGSCVKCISTVTVDGVICF